MFGSSTRTVAAPECGFESDTKTKEELGFFEEKKLAGFIEGPLPVTLRVQRQTGGRYSVRDGVGFGRSR